MQISAFQINFGSKQIYTPGDEADVLVAMNSAALKANIKNLKKGGLIIVNIAGFDKKNLALAKYAVNPLEDNTLQGYRLIKIDVNRMVSESLKESGLSFKDIDRSKNMFVLGVLYWLYSRPLDPTIQFINSKFGKKSPEVAAANIKVLNDGYTFGEATEIFTSRFEVKQADLEKGTYRNKANELRKAWQDLLRRLLKN